MESHVYQKINDWESDHWWFKARLNYLKILFRYYFSGDYNKKVLDVGCGTGGTTAYLKKIGFDTTGLDISDEALHFCRQKGLHVVKGSLGNLPFADNSFDMICALDVVEHIKDDQACMAEFYRVLKPKGLLIVMVPAHMWMWSYHDDMNHHVRRYRKDELGVCFAREFSDFRLTWMHCSVFPIMALLRLLKRFSLSEIKESDFDLKKPSQLENIILGVVYAVEMVCFRALRWLPWGSSLIGMGIK